MSRTVSASDRDLLGGLMEWGKEVSVSDCILLVVKLEVNFVSFIFENRNFFC